MTKNRNAKLAAKSDVSKDENMSYSKAITVRNRMIDPNRCVLKLGDEMEILQFDTEEDALQFSNSSDPKNYILLSETSIKKASDSVDSISESESEQLDILHSYGITCKKINDKSYPLFTEGGRNNWVQLKPNMFGLPGDSTRILTLSGRPGSGKTEMSRMMIKKALDNGARIISVGSNNSISIQGHLSKDLIDLSRIDPIQFMNSRFMSDRNNDEKIEFLMKSLALKSVPSHTEMEFESISEHIVSRNIESMQSLMERLSNGSEVDFDLIRGIIKSPYLDFSEDDLIPNILNLYIDSRSVEQQMQTINMIDFIHDIEKNPNVLLRYEMSSQGNFDDTDSYLKSLSSLLWITNKLDRLGGAAIIETPDNGINLSRGRQSEVLVKLIVRREDDGSYTREQDWFFNNASSHFPKPMSVSHRLDLKSS